MFANFLTFLKKRPKLDAEEEQPTSNNLQVDSQNLNTKNNLLSFVKNIRGSQNKQIFVIAKLDLEHLSENIICEAIASNSGVADEMEVDVPQDNSLPTNLNFGLLNTSQENSMDEPANSTWLQSIDDSKAQIDERNAIERPFNVNERFVTVLDQLDTRVEKLRKEAMGLQEKRDYLLMSIDLIKNNDMLHGMNEYEREEINCYIHRVNSRLSTVELNVRTVRDAAQDDSLHQVNVFIDSLITNDDAVTSRHRCQTFLNACSGSDQSQYGGGGVTSSSTSQNIDKLVDKKFESALLGCTLDDQKNIKKRLLALMSYLNKQTISG